MGTFLYRGPLPGGSPLFVDREVELTRLIEACQKEVEAYWIIQGGRQTGKTSLLLQLEIKLSGLIPVCHVDFQGLPGATAAQAYEFIAHEVACCLPYLSAAPKVESPPDLVEFLCQGINRLSGGRLVLLLEELGALPEDSRKDLAHVLRSIFSNRFAPRYSPLVNLMVVLAGSIELYDLAATKVSPLQNVCEFVYLPDLDRKNAVDLVRHGLTAAGLPEKEAISFGESIYLQVGGHPYLTQLIGGKLEAQLIDGRSLAPDSVNAAVVAILESDVLLRHLYGSVEDHKLWPALKDLLEGHVRFSRLDEQMARLELLGLAAGRDGTWQVRNPLLRRALEEWVAQRKSKRTAPESKVKPPKPGYVDAIDLLEERLRNFIDLQLSDRGHRQYWNSVIPGDITRRVEDRISKWLERHPYETRASFAQARRRLDFCDFGDYWFIINENWGEFSGCFKSNRDSRQHMDALSKLRNCVQHNRQPTEVEEMLGQAAIIWVSKVLDAYEHRPPVSIVRPDEHQATG